MPRAAPPALALGTYVGVLPCADCEGLRYQLELRGDQSYVLRHTYLGKGPHEAGRTVFDDIGRWLLSSDGAVLAIRGARELPEYFELLPQALRKLDREGQPVRSAANHLLRRVRNAARLEPQLPMQGHLHVDAAVFVDCTTGARWHIANEADWSAAERAVAKAVEEARPKAAAPLVSIEATQDGASLVIDRFNMVLEDKTACDPPFATLPLRGTLWALVRLGAQSEPLARGSYGAQLHLSAGRSAKVTGYSGCNRLISSAEVQGSNVRFGAQSASRVACVAGDAARVEAGLLDALAGARRWRTVGAVLELYGEDDQLLARFEGEATGR